MSDQTMYDKWNPRDEVPSNNKHSGYAVSGKIMLSAIVILFGVVIFMVCLHLYARWYLLRARRRQLRRNRRRAQLVFYLDPANPTITVPSSGLDASVLKSLPVFLYNPGKQPDSLECAVCLSEFEDGETGRTLPKCNHSFHIECIDMWFHSHSTCPLCRSPVEPVENLVELVVEQPEPVREGGSSSSDLCATCQVEDEGRGSSPAAADGGTSSSGPIRKPMELVGCSIEIPRWENRLEEFGTESSMSQSFKSPGSRLLSFKRILARGISLSPRAGGVGSSDCGSSEFDIERGVTERETLPSRAPTPR